jgi:hypothetical protein
MFAMASGSPDPSDPLRGAIRSAAERYAGLHPRFNWYIQAKYRLDPCYRAIARHIGAGTFTVDLGAGFGMLPVLLGVMGERRRSLGVEWDRDKVRCGVHACRALPDVSMVEGDLRAFPMPECDVVTLVDVLHYYDGGAQQEILARCRAALARGGLLLIREGDGARRRGSRFTRGFERAATRLGWNRGPSVRFRPIAELRASLGALGFDVVEEEVSGLFNPGNVLLVCQRERESVATGGGLKEKVGDR